MDSGICQTSTASPAEPGGLPLLLGKLTSQHDKLSNSLRRFNDSTSVITQNKSSTIDALPSRKKLAPNASGLRVLAHCVKPQVSGKVCHLVYECVNTSR
jgi:hypothetical protein